MIVLMVVNDTIDADMNDIGMIGFLAVILFIVDVIAMLIPWALVISNHD